MAEIESNETIHAKARYLYWACYRGHVNLIKHILENDKISPFARIYEGRSPMMASLIGKHANFKNQNLGNQNLSNAEAQIFSNLISNRSQIEICCREYRYPKDEQLLEN